jgi:RNA polymerase-associated protein CTR9
MADESRTIVIVGQGGIQTDLELDTLADPEVADAIPDLLADYSAECKDWTLIAGEHWRLDRRARAEELLQRGIKFFGAARHPDHTALVNLHAMLAHLHLALARTAPKTVLAHAKYDVLPSGTRTKEFHLTEATQHINRAEEALRSSGGTVEDEPVTVTMGKSELA